MVAPVIAQCALDIPRSGIRDVFDRVERVPDVISLCVGEPSATAAPHIVEAACRSIREGHTKYTNVLGIDAFRQAVARYSHTVKGLDYAPEHEIQAIDGATIGLFLALKAVLDPGDEVIIPSPFFTSYEAEVMMCGGVPVTVALTPEHQMRLNADDIEAAVTPRTRAVILTSPGNPSGAVTPADELARIADVCTRHNLWAISDEVYHPFIFKDDADASDASVDPATAARPFPVAPSIATVPGMHERTVVVESLSKTFAMTGWRIGYLLAPAALIEQTSKIAELMHSSVNSTAQYAAVAALTGPMDPVIAMREEYRAKRQIVLDGLADCTAVRLVEPQGAFYAFVDIRATRMSSDEFSRRLLDESKVAVVPGTAFGAEGEGFVRLSYAGDADELREGVRRLRRFAESHADPLLGRHTPEFHHLAVMA
ncbi:aspartate aminotransferase [Bifidobacterium ramosum]|uniref:Aminotransferase n=1 Tax=Bifidobacterium ramosum TaxID=1798158 RepID=A0A6L4X1T8_9BIFI|nr:pyridoxal phosphate-dependent aminotransferase [Bifidobacterium ramosum]KAB8288676.1 aspartate aminotransferase [Bifidobacterium ramosum]NEG71461.1 aminotransferase class I/II-fold pyridoxal phosphate-dependent enzyme [Bifidobacterium ramosum]